MVLKFKKTIYDPLFEKTNNNEGLSDNDFWININFTLKNDEIDYKGVIPGMSFNELKKWNDVNKKFIDNEMKNDVVVSFIRKFGELYYHPKQGIVEKRVYLFDDVNKYYNIILDKEEIKNIYEGTKLFINSIENK